MNTHRLSAIIRFLFLCGILLLVHPELNAAAVASPNAAPATPLSALDYNGDGPTVNPATTPVSVAAGPLFIQPVLSVAAADRGQTAHLFIYIYLPQARAGFNFSAPRPVTLGDEADFSAVFPRVIDMSDGGGAVFDVYCGYALDNGDIRYNAYEVTLTGGNGDSGNPLDDQAADQFDRRLQDGSTPAAALGQLSTEMAGKPEVAGAVVTADQTGLWVVYKSGEQVLFEVEDLDQPANDYAAGFAGFGERELSTRTGISPAGVQPTGSLASWPLGPSDCAFPETNQALLINSLTVCMPSYGDYGYDTTKAIADMLQHVGYEVKRLPGSLDDFTTLTNYSVIFIEAGTSRQTADELLNVLCELPILPENNPINASIEGSSEAITTSTVVTPALRKQYADDLRFGRLKVRRSWYLFRGKVTRCTPTFAVTPNFIRQHNQGRFPNHTLLYISAGGLLDVNTQASQWQALLAEKSDNGHFISWLGKPKYVFSQLAAANLFELLTGADYKFYVKTRITNLPDGRTLIKDELNSNQVIPPLVNVGLYEAMGALAIAGDVFDLTSGAMLNFTNHGSQTREFALAPILNDFFIDQLGRADVLGAAPAGSQARFVNDLNPNGGLDYDLGECGFPSYDTPVFANWSYHINIPIGIAGTLELRDPLGRHSTGMIVYTWKPQFKVTWQGDGGQQYTVGLTLWARALPAPRSRGLKDQSDPYSAPRNNAIAGRFEGQASAVNWSVAGEQTSGQYHYKYHGSGLEQITFMDEDNWPTNAIFSTVDSDDGTELTVDVNFGQVKLTYTETRTDTADHTSTETQKTIPLQSLYLEGLRVDPRTMVLQADTLTTTSNGNTVTVRWSDEAPSPAFRRFTGPR